jgi:hypothetical protein
MLHATLKLGLAIMDAVATLVIVGIVTQGGATVFASKLRIFAVLNARGCICAREISQIEQNHQNH